MQSITNSASEPTKKSKEFSERPFYAGFLFFAGVLLPLVSFIVELSSDWCAELFFDPMPTWWHVLLVAFVPITNLQTWWAMRNKKTERLAWLGFSNSLVFFIAFFYTIVYAPLFPLSVIALIFFFVGILGMTPMFALLATILQLRELRKIVPEGKPFGITWATLGAAFLAFLILISIAEMPYTLTKIGINMALSDNPQRQAKGLQFLRRYGSDDYLLRNCYYNSGKVNSDVISGFFGNENGFSFFDDNFDGENSSFTNVEKVRTIYYRLHGKPSDSMPLPRGAKDWGRVMLTDFSDEAEAANNRFAQGLSLSGSQIDGSVDGDAALGYLEWTMTVKNDKTWQQEAVTNIQLPPNAVVSRLTLWINGEEREAAFAGRERVTAAYDAVTAKRRDPVLVTTAGRDRIALKAFPVPAHGEMKFRIGITVPLILENESNGLLLLPHFNERNFSIGTEHAIWIESKKPLEAANPAFTIETSQGTTNLSGVRGKISNADLVKIGSPVRAAKSPDVKTAWARTAPNSGEIVRQEVGENTDKKPANLVFIVDANAKMKSSQNELAAAIRRLPADAQISLVLTGGNGLNLETATPNNFSGNSNDIAAKIESATFAGGTDGVAALERAWELSETLPDSAIIWLHAPQNLKLSSGDALKERIVRRPQSVPIYSLQITNGANVVEKEIDGFGKIRSVPRFGNFADDLQRFLSNLNQTQKQFVAARHVEKLSNLPNAKETSAHLVRLWANEEVSRLLENNEDKAALEMSVKYQLVTPVSGAVVLETKEQYEQFGLRPVDVKTVPTIPEPEEYLLFAVVLMILGWLGWRFARRGAVAN